MGLMTYGAQIAAGAGSLWNCCRLPQGFAGRTLGRHGDWGLGLCLVNLYDFQFPTERLFFNHLKGFNGLKGTINICITFVLILKKKTKNINARDCFLNDHYLWHHMMICLLRKIVITGPYDSCLSVSLWHITSHVASVCSHRWDLSVFLALLLCPHLTWCLAIISSWTDTDDIGVLSALRWWKVDLMGFQMLHCECKLLRGKR